MFLFFIEGLSGLKISSYISVRMAGRRVALKAIDWVAFAERVPPNQRGMFNALKTRSDAVAAKLVFHQQQALESQLHSHCTELHSCQNWTVVDVFFLLLRSRIESV